ncbi:helix-turn-helix domain-containing protein [Coprococcus sp. TF11-13]|jgi:transcriptional regulator with XRE-family HTH domain|uniref:helix-turn-helix domain-containing protein n=1 Tax=Coprococcus sp. TF11-13 TaxID=2293096 RepID=UPI000E537301|nr:helix-turn-helix transcriptional regulator [Coprococcus sp. TF11-13]MBS5489620.1 helix-turn-helix domain-containing protein [Clostridiales bacterium]MBS6679929.1 helix-turn-helix domain-containing protein [Roseburia sp.]RHU51055.1 transcriptional regulator [Coprococcus sp. TF11-13]
MANLSDRIKSLRLSADMTQEEFGKKFGIVKSTVSLYESGKSTPNDQIKKQICDYFHVSLDYLLGVDRQGGLDYANFQIDESEFALDFKMRIRELISEQGMTEDDFMQNTGFSKDEMDAYLYGNRMPSIEDLIKITGALNVSADYLLAISKRKRISSDEESLLQLFNKCDEQCKNYLVAKAGVLCVEGISAVAAGEYGKYADEEKKSFPSSGTEGKGA